MRIRFQQLRIIADSNGEKEIILLAEISLNAADDGGAVEVSDLLGDHTNHVGAFHSQIASVKAWTILQLTSGLENSFLGVRWNRPGCRSLVQDRRTSPLCEPHPFG